MSKSRREFIALSGKSLAAGLLLGSTGLAWPEPARWKAILFDGLVIFDPRPVFQLADELFPGRGAELSSIWRSRQFEYTWLRNSMGDYADFWQVTQDALAFAAAFLKLDLTEEKRDRLMNGFLHLRAFPDVIESVKTFRRAGLKLALLSNFTARMMQAGVSNSGLDGLFDHLLSTDAVRAFKPSPRAYEMGLRAFKLKRAQMVFAAFGGWDVAGAKRFGYPTFWVNRANQPVEQLGAAPNGAGAGLAELVTFVSP